MKSKELCFVTLAAATASCPGPSTGRTVIRGSGKSARYSRHITIISPIVIVILPFF